MIVRVGAAEDSTWERTKTAGKWVKVGLAAAFVTWAARELYVENKRSKKGRVYYG